MHNLYDIHPTRQGFKLSTTELCAVTSQKLSHQDRLKARAVLDRVDRVLEAWEHFQIDRVFRFVDIKRIISVLETYHRF